MVGNFGWFAEDLRCGNLEEVYDTLPNGLNIGTIVRGKSKIPKMESGRFILLAGVASLTKGDWVGYNSISGVVTRSPAANSGRALAVALANPISSSQFGWYQIEGVAFAKVGTPVADSPLYFNTAGAAFTTATDGKQILGATCLVGANYNIDPAIGALAVSEAYVDLARPHMQGRIL